MNVEFETHNNSSGESFNAEEDALTLERELYNLQENIKKAKVDYADGSKELADLMSQENKLLKVIAVKAREMIKNEDAMINKIAKEFDKVTDVAPQGEKREEFIIQGITKTVDYIKKRVYEYATQSKILGEKELLDVLAKMDGCVTANREEFVNKVSNVLQPIVEARDKNPESRKSAEIAERNSFLNGSIVDGTRTENFIPIEGTDNILSYGIGRDSIHLHLGPIRTLTPGEKMRFVKETVPNAFKKIAQILELDKNKEIKFVSATSFIVAAKPELFQKYGFSVKAMDIDSRNKHWEKETKPILTAVISRDEFQRIMKKVNFK